MDDSSIFFLFMGKKARDYEFIRTLKFLRFTQWQFCSLNDISEAIYVKGINYIVGNNYIQIDIDFHNIILNIVFLWSALLFV